MNEYGSDFHACGYPHGASTLSAAYPVYRSYASGRVALGELARWRGYRRLLFPTYFCHESVRRLPGVAFYPYAPGDDINTAVRAAGAGVGDAIVVCNCWGLDTQPDYTGLTCEIIEDHTHDLISHWARSSRAHWCVASVRKTLPVPDGGILWSPRGLALPPQPASDPDWCGIMDRRFGAMQTKLAYLQGASVDKAVFLNDFVYTEECFDTAATGNWSEHTADIVAGLDVEAWYANKRANRDVLCAALRPDSGYIIPVAAAEGATPLSLVLIFDNPERRERVRRALIARDVYPAVLWRLPEGAYDPADISGRMLSIHCDARYTPADMAAMATTINETLALR